MTRFPYRFAGGDGPRLDGRTPVIYSRTVEFLSRCAHHRDIRPVCCLLVVRSLEGHSVAYTNDPDFEWNHYRAECHEQAQRIVHDGLRKALPWLRDEVLS